jgi:hypothetical protein
MLYNLYHPYWFLTLLVFLTGCVKWAFRLRESWLLLLILGILLLLWNLEVIYRVDNNPPLTSIPIQKKVYPKFLHIICLIYIDIYIILHT